MSNPIVFLSHSSKDKKTLADFKNALVKKTNGTVDFFLSSDGESIPVGANWVSSVEAALNRAKLAFLFITPNSVNSTWVAFEAGWMASKGIQVVPVGLPGVDLAQVPTPLSLLQGFNVHTAAQMGNVLQTLNRTFGHQHRAKFSEADFHKIFGFGSILGSGFFAEHSALVQGVKFSGKVKSGGDEQSILKNFGELLRKKGLELVLAKRVPENPESGYMGSAPGIKAEVWEDEPLHFVVSVHGTMCSLVLPLITDYLKLLLNQTWGSVDFVDGVWPCGENLALTSRAYGTKFEVVRDTQLRFKDVLIGGKSGFAPLYFESPVPMSADKLRTIIQTLFAAKILIYDPSRAKSAPFSLPSYNS